ncbi:MAG: lam16B [Fibrobacteres bacterium]|nr:lam16B [Fibrobacterota bacterium]
MGEMKNILGGLILAGAFCLAHAQSSVDISGTVNSAKGGAAVAGAKVFLAGNPSITTTTDASGNFHLVGSGAVGVRNGKQAGKAELSFKGTELSFTVPENNTPVTVDIFNLKSEHVRNLVSRTATAGRYTLNAAPSDLSGGLYLVRARVGKQSSAFKMTTLGMNSKSSGLFANAAFLRTGLAKVSADPVDSLLITKEGFKPFAKVLTKFTGIFPLSINPKLPPGDLKIVSERNFPQVDWGSNVDVQVWDGGTLLKGDYAPSPFEGTQSWLVTMVAAQPYNAWGFVSKPGTPEDMSAWKDGSMHLAVKGTATSVGVTMGSTDQAGGNSVKVDLRDYGYLPDNKWHESIVPLSAFTGTDFSSIEVYCGLVYPVMADTAVFDPDLFYQVDDIYWKITK